MRKVIPIIFLCFIFSQNLYAKLYARDIRWCTEGPGGIYGIIEWNSFGCDVYMGPLQFRSGFDLETARLIYFGIIPILIIGSVIAVLLSFKCRKNYGNTVIFSWKYFKKYWDYYFLVLIMVLGIYSFIWVPKCLDYRRRERQSELYQTFINKDFEQFKKLISEDNINEELFIEKETGDSLCVTPLIIAARAGNLPLVKFLIAKGANVRQGTGYGTALHYAADLDVAKLLIKYGSNVNATDNWGKSPLDTVDSEQVKKYLIEQGAKTSEQIFRSIKQGIN
jgi:hypothetical protein